MKFKSNLGMTLKIQALDKSDIIRITVIFSATDIKIKIGTTVGSIKHDITYGELVDIYISCTGLAFQVVLFLNMNR